MVRPPHPMDFLTASHVPFPSLVLPGSVLWLDCLILKMVWHPSTCHARHLVYVLVGSFVCPYIRMKLAHPCTAVWLISSTVFSHPCTTVWLSLSMEFDIYIYVLPKFLYGDVVGDVS